MTKPCDCKALYRSSILLAASSAPARPSGKSGPVFVDQAVSVEVLAGLPIEARHRIVRDPGFTGTDGTAVGGLRFRFTRK